MNKSNTKGTENTYAKGFSWEREKYLVNGKEGKIPETKVNAALTRPRLKGGNLVTEFNPKLRLTPPREARSGRVKPQFCLWIKKKHENTCILVY